MPLSLLTFAVTLTFSFHITTSSYFPNCTPTSFSCGSIQNISYPFTGGSRPGHCGPPEFRLTCINNQTHLTINSVTYIILRINQTRKTLTLTRSDLNNTTCTHQFINSTFNPTIFNYGLENDDLTLIYGCNSSFITITPHNLFTCNASNVGFGGANFTDSFYLVGPVPNDPVLNEFYCRVNVRVPILRRVGERLTRYRTGLGEALGEGFSLNYSDPYENVCLECGYIGGECVFYQNSSDPNPICFCGDYPCPLSGSIQTSSHLNIRIRFTIGFSVGVAVIIIFIVIIYCHRRKCLSVRALFFWKKERMQNQNIEAFIGNYGSIAPKQYKYSDIRKMTNLFREKLGQGGYGSVYKGILSDGRLVAVKLLNETKGDGEEFINEVASISRTSHVNVVTLLGFCYQGSKRALIYEFMPNGSLDKFIYKDGSPNTASRLEWKTLYQIAIGTARGLEYLHRGCNTQIVHFDIKPQNILLDEDFCPKIADFGLAKLCQRKKSIVSIFGARGTAGYIAPEVFCRNFGSVSHKSDVYSYGMMVLEMAGARKNNDIGEASASETYFPDWIYEHLQIGEGVGLQDLMTAEEEETANKMVLGGLWCIQTNPADRPSMSKVVEMLEGSLQSLQIPPKPVLFSHPRSPLVLESLMSLSSNWDSHESLHSISAP